jgi:peptidyl-prolyl cis-trans isomerase C
MKRVSYAVLGVCILAALQFFSGCTPRDGEDEVVARVGNTVLTRKDMTLRMEWEGLRADQESEYIQRWVNRELLYQEAKKQGLPTSQELQWEIELLQKEYLIQKMLERKFSENIRVTDEEIEACYETDKEQFRVDADEVHLFHILTESREEANQALQEIRAGKAFEEVARERSVGVFRDKGGDMGFVRRTDLIPEVSRQAFGLAVGREGGPYHSQYGYHIIKVLKKRSKGSIKDLSDIRDQIIQRLRVSDERSLYYELLSQLRSTRNVYVAAPAQDESVQE